MPDSIFDAIKLKERLVSLLIEIGISRERSAHIVNNYFEHSVCSNFKNQKGKHCITKIILDFLVQCFLDLKTHERDIPLLICFLQKNENDLNHFDYGRLLHLKSVSAWKIDNDILFAMHYINSSIEILTKLYHLEAKGYLARVYDSLGQLLVSRGAWTDARLEFLKALKGRELINDDEGMAITLGNLGRLSMQLGDFRNAISFLTKDYNIVKKNRSNNTSLKAQLLSTMCICYVELGDMEKAENINQLSRNFNTSAKNLVGLIFNNINEAKIAFKLSRFELASKLVQDIKRDLKDLRISNYIHNNINGRVSHIEANILCMQKRFFEANVCFERAFVIYNRELSVSPVETAELLHDYAKLEANYGDTMMAGNLYRKSLRYLDLTEEHSSRSIIENEMKTRFMDSLILHSAGRFLGHEQINFILDEAGKGNYAGEEKDVAVLFTDIRGFTSLTEQLPPKQLIEILNNFLSIMTKSIETYGGFVDKFIGDSIMAIFRLPEPKVFGPGNDSESAILAALLMIEELKRFNRNLSGDLPEFKIGIGIHSGKITAGLIGSPQKRSYTVIGDVANTASRLEGMTKILGAEILVSKSVYERCTRNDFITRPLGRFCPKGRASFVDVFDIMRLDDGSSKLQLLRHGCKSTETALNYFYRREFEKARFEYKTLFEKNINTNRCKAYKIMLKAISDKIAQPPDEKWEGEIILDKK
jgi:class 3 adenylate cyclase